MPTSTVRKSFKEPWAVFLLFISQDRPPKSNRRIGGFNRQTYNLLKTGLSRNPSISFFHTASAEYESNRAVNHEAGAQNCTVARMKASATMTTDGVVILAESFSRSFKEIGGHLFVIRNTSGEIVAEMPQCVGCDGEGRRLSNRASVVSCLRVKKLFWR